MEANGPARLNVMNGKVRLFRYFAVGAVLPAGGLLLLNAAVSPIQIGLASLVAGFLMALLALKFHFLG